MGRNKKVFTGCSSLDTKFPTGSQTSATIFRCFFLQRAKCLCKIYISCVPGVNQMVPLSIIAIIAWNGLNGFHFTSLLLFTSCVLSSKWQQIVCCQLALNYLCPRINLSLIPLNFSSNQIQMQIVQQIQMQKVQQIFCEKKMCHEMFSGLFHTSPVVQPSVNIELTSLSEAGCEAIRVKRNNLAGPSRFWHNLNVAMTSASDI